MEIAAFLNATRVLAEATSSSTEKRKTITAFCEAVSTQNLETALRSWIQFVKECPSDVINTHRQLLVSAENCLSHWSNVFAREAATSVREKLNQTTASSSSSSISHSSSPPPPATGTMLSEPPSSSSSSGALTSSGFSSTTPASSGSSVSSKPPPEPSELEDVEDDEDPIIGSEASREFLSTLLDKKPQDFEMVKVLIEFTPQNFRKLKALVAPSQAIEETAANFKRLKTSIANTTKNFEQLKTLIDTPLAFVNEVLFDERDFQLMTEGDEIHRHIEQFVSTLRRRLEKWSSGLNKEDLPLLSKLIAKLEDLEEFSFDLPRREMEKLQETIQFFKDLYSSSTSKKKTAFRPLPGFTPETIKALIKVKEIGGLAPAELRELSRLTGSKPTLKEQLLSLYHSPIDRMAELVVFLQQKRGTPNWRAAVRSLFDAMDYRAQQWFFWQMKKFISDETLPFMVAEAVGSKLDDRVKCIFDLQALDTRGFFLDSYLRSDQNTIAPQVIADYISSSSDLGYVLANTWQFSESRNMEIACSLLQFSVGSLLQFRNNIQLLIRFDNNLPNPLREKIIPQIFEWLEGHIETLQAMDIELFCPLQDHSMDVVDRFLDILKKPNHIRYLSASGELLRSTYMGYNPEAQQKLCDALLSGALHTEELEELTLSLRTTTLSSFEKVAKIKELIPNIKKVNLIVEDFPLLATVNLDRLNILGIFFEGGIPLSVALKALAKNPTRSSITELHLDGFYNFDLWEKDFKYSLKKLLNNPNLQTIFFHRNLSYGLPSDFARVGLKHIKDDLYQFKNRTIQIKCEGK